MPRILAACIATFGLANAIAGLFRPELDANIWWIDLRWLPDGLARVIVTGASLALLAFALFPNMTPIRRTVSAATVAMLLAACFVNCVTYFRLLLRGEIQTSLPVPLSAFVVGAFVWIAADIIFRKDLPRDLNWKTAVPALLVCLLGFPLAQIFLFGKTNYSRSADAAIVFGARVYADGHASTALADRVRSACDLYQRGLVKSVIVSGGPGDGVYHETDVMRALAKQWGVNEDDIVVDRAGLNTRATLENIRRLYDDQRQPRMRFLAVSHFYHLPRIKMEGQRLGMDIVTVPAHESYTLKIMPLLIGREVAALWKYYLFPPA